MHISNVQYIAYMHIMQHKHCNYQYCKVQCTLVLWVQDSGGLITVLVQYAHYEQYADYATQTLQ